MMLFFFRSFSKKAATQARRRARGKAKVRAAKQRPLRVGSLEDRVLLSAFLVTTTADNGDNSNPVPGSLRDAIMHIDGDVNPDGSSKLSYTNSDPTRDEIDFAIPGNDPQHYYYKDNGVLGGVSLSDASGNSLIGVTTVDETGLTPAQVQAAIPGIDPDYLHTWYSIQPSAPLPDIQNAAIVDGYTQAGSSANSLLGVSALGSMDSKLNPQNYGDNAVLKIQLDGANAGGNLSSQGGLWIQTDDITVQGLVVNRFAADGIEIHNPYGGQTSGDVIQGNFVGTDVSGTLAQGLGNGLYGVDAHFAAATIGGTSPAARNVISGNLNDGVAVYGTGSIVQGNLIGTDVTGGNRLGNAGGILLDGSNALIGGPEPGAGNVISGNNGGAFGAGGIAILGSYYTIEGNFIGADVTGITLLRNSGYPGIAARGDHETFTGNLFAETSGGGILAGGPAGPVSDSTIQGNFFGTDVTGTQSLDASDYPGDVNISGSDDTIGGPDPSGTGPLSGEGNLFTGWVRLAGSELKVQGNFFGTNVTGTEVLGAGTQLLLDTGSAGNTIGGADTNAPGGPLSGAGNLFANGAVVIYSNASGNVVAGNYLGTNITGTAMLGAGSGVYLGPDTTNNTIGGSSAAYRNIIVGTTSVFPSAGVWLDGPATDNGAYSNVVEGNYIGTDATGSFALGGFARDIYVVSSGNTIGGTAEGAGNIIDGASQAGIAVGKPSSGYFPSDNVIEGNMIGTDSTGTQTVGSDGNSLGNPGMGLEIAGTNNTVLDNVVAGNGGDGVFVENATGVSIVGNSIYANAGLGIHLDSATNANNNQAAPVLTAVYAASGATIITGTISSTPNTTATVEFFANAPGDPEGQTLLGRLSVSADGAGNGSFIAVLQATLPAGQELVTATVTDAGGDTSEFSAGVTAVPLPPSSLSGVVWEDFNDDGQVDFGEKGIGGVTVTLTGTDFLGNAVNLSQTTDSDGAYVFLNLLPGNYTITESPPAGYTQGIDSVGTAGGSVSAPGQFSVPLGVGVDGLNYNFGELPAAGGPIQAGQTAGIGFWNNKNGQALIKAFNGGTGTQLADWLAATLPNIFGANSASDLTGQSNASVAALFQHDFLLKGVKLDAQVLATALNVYATNATLDSTAVAAQYGFVVSGDGAGTAAINVGSNGDAFGVANDTSLTVMDLLLAADAQAVDGVLYDGNATLRKEANNIFSAVNQAGGIN